MRSCSASILSNNLETGGNSEIPMYEFISFAGPLFLNNGLNNGIWLNQRINSLFLTIKCSSEIRKTLTDSFSDVNTIPTVKVYLKHFIFLNLVNLCQPFKNKIFIRLSLKGKIDLIRKKID